MVTFEFTLNYFNAILNLEVMDYSIFKFLNTSVLAIIFALKHYHTIYLILVVMWVHLLAWLFYDMCITFSNVFNKKHNYVYSTSNFNNLGNKLSFLYKKNSLQKFYLYICCKIFLIRNSLVVKQ